MKRFRSLWIIPFIIGICAICPAVESGMYRLLSVSTSEKLIVVSHIPTKTRYILDAAPAKITLNGKPAEFRKLKSFSIIQVKVELKKEDRKGIDIDGKAIEINISDAGEPGEEP